MQKHELVPCDRCGTKIECKSNAFSKCDCSKVFLTPNEIEWIGESYESCLCATCLLALKAEYQENLKSSKS